MMDALQTLQPGTMFHYEDLLKVSSEWFVHICLAFGIYFLFRKYGGSVQPL